MRATREALAGVGTSFHHAGLYFQRYLPEHDSESSDKQKDEKPVIPFLNALQRAPIPPAYEIAYKRWKRQWDLPQNGIVMEAELASALAVGMGNSNPIENGLALHHTYGVPIIPGSALKGMTLRVLQSLVDAGKLEQGIVHALFGTAPEKGADKNSDDSLTMDGAVRFEDAWFVPDSVNNKPLHRDIITVHHQNYYGKSGKEGAPTDFDDPNPIPFLVVRPGAKFLFVLTIKEEIGDAVTAKLWLDYVAEALLWGMANNGAGGKTNAGYGYFKPQSSPNMSLKPTDANVSSATIDTNVWSDCDMRRKDEKRGGWVVQVQGKEGYLEIPQGQWSKLLGNPPVPKKDERFKAEVVVQQDNGKFIVVEVRRK